MNAHAAATPTIPAAAPLVVPPWLRIVPPTATMMMACMSLHMDATYPRSIQNAMNIIGSKVPPMPQGAP